jgi:hypothetical protein
MKIIISERQYSFISEQPDSKMPFQIEKFGYNPSKPNTMGPALKKQQEVFNYISKYVNLNLESDLRDFLYSPAGIATIVGIDFLGGEAISMALFSILVGYDIKKWIDVGEPNWLFLIVDLICVVTAGFASAEGAILLKLAKNIKFKTLTGFFEYIFKNFKFLWTNFVSPLVKSIGSVIGKIVPRITKMKSYLSKKLSSSLSSIGSYLSNLGKLITESFEKVIGKLGVKVGKTYAKYKLTSTAANQVLKTDKGKEIIKTSLPYINPLLGADKIDPFLLDLITNPDGIKIGDYKINPIFSDNSKDTF